MKRIFRLMGASMVAALGFVASASGQDAARPPLVTDPQTITVMAPQSVVVEGANAGDIRPWGGIQYTTGPGIGYGDKESYSTLEGFIPVFQGNAGILFADLRGSLTNNSLVSSNLGGGYRYYSEAERLWGANLFWDNRDTGSHTFNQVGFGFESLGRAWDARANVYLVTSRDQKETFAFYNNPVFVNHFIQLDRTGVGQAAMSGFDAEIGAPISCAYGLKAFVGTYNFEVDQSKQAWGIKGRVEERVSDNLDMSLTWANDQVFGNSVIFQVGYRFGGRSTRAGAARCDTYARRADRIERNHQIVVTDQVLKTHELACDPNSPTRAPIIVEHVASYAAPGGDGTVEHPFNNLGDLQTGSRPGNILFAHANSVFDMQSITLQNNQRFLGEGCLHLFTACQGTFVLPGIQDHAVRPQITNSIGDAVTLANNNEVSGFVITNPSGNGIFGQNITNFNMNCNVINLAGNGCRGGGGGEALAVIQPLQSGPGAGSGILLVNAGGTGVIDNNVITGSRERGIWIDTNANLGATITNNQSVGNCLANLRIDSRDGAQVDATIAGNTLSNSQNTYGLRLFSHNDSMLTARVLNNTIENNNQDGIFIQRHNQSTLTATVSNNVINGNGPNGILAESLNSNTGLLTANIFNNTITGNGRGDDGNGITLTAGGRGQITANILNNNVSFNLDNGINLHADERGVILATVSGNTISGNRDSGFIAESEDNNNSQHQIRLTLTSNTFVGNNTNNRFDEADIRLELEHGSKGFNGLVAQVNGNTITSLVGQDSFQALLDPFNNGGSGTFCLGLHGNTANNGFFLTRNSGTFNKESDSQATTNFGTINLVAPGTCMP